MKTPLLVCIIIAVFIAHAHSGKASTGDYNQDGRADAEDLAQWESDFDSSGHHQRSDSDGDGDTDGGDFLAWQLAFTSALSGESLVAPEPNTLLLMIPLLIMFLVRRPRRPTVRRFDEAHGIGRPNWRLVRSKQK